MVRRCSGVLAGVLAGALLSGCGAGASASAPGETAGRSGVDVPTDTGTGAGGTDTGASVDGTSADGATSPSAPSDGGVPSSPPAGAPAAAAGVTVAPIPRFRCGSPTVQVATADQLTAALAQATAGQVIRLADGVYTGTFTTNRSGTAAAPIELCGGRGAIVDGGSITGGYALHLDGVAHWRVSGFTVRNGQKGVMVDAGTDIGLQDLLVEDIGDEGVHLRRNSTGNVVRGLTVRGTGKRRAKFGEGIYIGTAQSNWKTVTGGAPDHSDHNFVLENTVSATTAESVDIKEGTTGGVLAGNTFDGGALKGADSWVDVKGNGWQIIGNTGRVTPKDGFQTHVVVDGWGDRNVFAGNSADLAGGDGVAVYLHHPLQNRITCSNKVVGGPLTNAAPCAG